MAAATTAATRAGGALTGPAGDSTAATLPDRIIGTSLKMYFSHARTLEWAAEVSELGRTHPAVTSGAAGLFLLPQFPSIPECVALDGPLLIGAQDVAAADSGAWTGEVSASVLAELGCRFAEVGHAERRRHFHETDDVVSAKTATALRHGLVPVLCVGEESSVSPEQAAAEVMVQIRSALPPASAELPRPMSVVLAYEPVWAIGAPAPADPEHITEVCRLVRSRTRTHFPALDFRLIYGGSARPGLLTRLGPAVDGLFLGRFAHETDSVREILDEVADVIKLSP